MCESLSQVSSSLVSRLCCSRNNQTKGVQQCLPPSPPLWSHPTQKKVFTVKLVQGLDQAWETFSESIGEQNLTRPSMLIRRLTLSFVTKNGFLPIGCSRSPERKLTLKEYGFKLTMFSFNRLNPLKKRVLCPLSKKITLPSKDNVSLFAISGDGAVVTFTVTRPEVRKDHVRLLTDSDIESSFSKYRK